MTYEPMPAQQPSPPKPPAPRRGLAGLVAGALIFSALVLLIVPVVTFRMLLAFTSAAAVGTSTFVTSMSAADEGQYSSWQPAPLEEAPQPEPSAGSAPVPAEMPSVLPWDVRVDGEAYTVIENSRGAWSESGCTVEGSTVPTSDLTDAEGDRAASIELLERRYGLVLADGDVADTLIVGADATDRLGSADALAVDLSESRGGGMAIARAFSATGEALIYEVRCDDDSLLPQGRADVDRFLVVKLIPAY